MLHAYMGQLGTAHGYRACSILRLPARADQLWYINWKVSTEGEKEVEENVI